MLEKLRRSKRKAITVLASTLLGCSIVAGATVFADSNKNADATFSVTLNGIAVNDANAHKENDTYYLSVPVFADFYHASINWEPSKKTLTLNGKKVTDQYGSIYVYKGVLTAPAQALQETLGIDEVIHSAMGVDTPSTNKMVKNETLNITILPNGVEQITPMVPGMGEHWFNLNAAPDGGMPPNGPIFGTINGKLVFIEAMIEQSAFVDGKSWLIEGMQGLPAPPVDHTDIQFERHGHAGMEMPHFDIHMYFVSHDDHNLAGPPAIMGEPMIHGGRVNIAYFIGGVIAGTNEGEGHGVITVDGVKQDDLLTDQIGSWSKELDPGDHTIKIELVDHAGKPYPGAVQEMTVTVPETSNH
ncbi:hypothetical protein [Bacillus sp. FJAT-29814]|uniref:hypothetical protein n=1 Tax=Bacillus sp. FJAT-29814 TaxID=1729688 RepID=UPI00082EA78B|nr:hypothetical protein [Bacillus sp. FJAT-29814]